MLVSLNSNSVIKLPAMTIDHREIHSILSEVFPGRKPLLIQRVLNGYNYTWNIPIAAGESWRELGKATPNEQSIIMDELKRYRMAIAEKIKLSDDILNALFTTPDLDRYLFFCVSGGKYKIAITGWGLQYKNASIDREKALVILKEGNVMSKCKVTIGFTHCGKLLPDVNFGLRLPSGTIKNFRTTSEGKLNLGELPIGSEFDVEVFDISQHYKLIVQPSKTTYFFDIAGLDDSENAGRRKNDAPKSNLTDPGKQGVRGGKKVKKAPKPFTPDPKKIIYDAERRSMIYSNYIFAIIDSIKSNANNPIDEFVGQVSRLYPMTQLINRDEFCDMVIFTVAESERERILRELPKRIPSVNFYADCHHGFYRNGCANGKYGCSELAFECCRGENRASTYYGFKKCEDCCYRFIFRFRASCISSSESGVRTIFGEWHRQCIAYRHI